MRFRCGLAACLFFALSSSVSADSRVFVIAAQADGYGIDQCLANGERCGAHAARAYCQSREFAEASTYRQLDPTEITSSAAEFANTSCRGATCGRPIAITCAR
jgi:hypothetical protein